MGGHSSQLQSAYALEALEMVRHICRELPEVEEVIDGFGHTTFKVRGKSFILMGESEQGFRLSFKSDRENQEMLIQQSRYHKTPYIGQHGWVSTSSEEDLHWEELAGLLKEAFLRAAPKRMVKELLNAMKSAQPLP